MAAEDDDALCCRISVSERTAVGKRIAYAAAVAEEKGRSAQHNEVYLFSFVLSSNLSCCCFGPWLSEARVCFVYK